MVFNTLLVHMNLYSTNVLPSSCKNSTASRIMYGLLLLVTVLISCLMLAPGVQEWLTKVETIVKLVKVLHQIV